MIHLNQGCGGVFFRDLKLIYENKEIMLKL